MSQIRKIAGNMPIDREAVLDELFKNMPNDENWEVNLPSQGRFYTNFISATVSPLKFQDEEKILSSSGKGSNIINMLLEACVKGITVNELLPMDKLYLLMKIREISYGSAYEFPIGCPACDTEIKTKIDLGKHFNISEIPEDLTDPREVMLPKLGIKVEVRFPRTKDEVYLEDAKSAVSNIYRFINSIGKITDPVLISKAVKRMHIQDVKTIIKAVNREEYGIDPRFQFECPSCNEKTLMAIPLGVDFFSVS